MREGNLLRKEEEGGGRRRRKGGYEKEDYWRRVSLAATRTMADANNDTSPDQSLFPVFALSMLTMILIPSTLYFIVNKDENEESAQERSEAFKKKSLPPYSGKKNYKLKTGKSYCSFCVIQS